MVGMFSALGGEFELKITPKEQMQMEPTQTARPVRRRGTSKALHNFTMRLHNEDAAKFIRWCEEERLSYREGFERLVGLIDKTQSNG